MRNAQFIFLVIFITVLLGSNVNAQVGASASGSAGVGGAATGGAGGAYCGFTQLDTAALNKPPVGPTAGTQLATQCTTFNSGITAAAKGLESITKIANGCGSDFTNKGLKGCQEPATGAATTCSSAGTAAQTKFEKEKAACIRAAVLIASCIEFAQLELNAKVQAEQKTAAAAAKAYNACMTTMCSTVNSFVSGATTDITGVLAGECLDCATRADANGAIAQIREYALAAAPGGKCDNQISGGKLTEMANKIKAADAQGMAERSAAARLKIDEAAAATTGLDAASKGVGIASGLVGIATGLKSLFGDSPAEADSGKSNAPPFSACAVCNAESYVPPRGGNAAFCRANPTLCNPDGISDAAAEEDLCRKQPTLSICRGPQTPDAHATVSNQDNVNNAAVSQAQGSKKMADAFRSQRKSRASVDGSILRDPASGAQQDLALLSKSADQGGLGSIIVLNKGSLMFEMTGKGNMGVENKGLLFSISGGGTTQMEVGRMPGALIEKQGRIFGLAPGRTVYTGSGTATPDVFTTESSMLDFNTNFFTSACNNDALAVSFEHEKTSTGPTSASAVDVTTTNKGVAVYMDGCSDVLLLGNGGAVPLHARTSAKGSSHSVYFRKPALLETYNVEDAAGFKYSVSPEGTVTSGKKIVQSMKFPKPTGLDKRLLYDSRLA